MAPKSIVLATDGKLASLLVRECSRYGIKLETGETGADVGLDQTCGRSSRKPKATSRTVTSNSRDARARRLSLTPKVAKQDVQGEVTNLRRVGATSSMGPLRTSLHGSAGPELA